MRERSNKIPDGEKAIESTAGFSFCRCLFERFLHELLIFWVVQRDEAIVCVLLHIILVLIIDDTGGGRVGLLAPGSACIVVGRRVDLQLANEESVQVVHVGENASGIHHAFVEFAPAEGLESISTKLDSSIDDLDIAPLA